MPRVRFRNSVTGDELWLPYCSTRVQAHVTVEWYFKYVAELLQWPVEFIRLLVTGLDGHSRIQRYLKASPLPPAPFTIAGLLVAGLEAWQYLDRLGYCWLVGFLLLGAAGRTHGMMAG